jgi:hypothetical protein
MLRRATGYDVPRRDARLYEVRPECGDRRLRLRRGEGGAGETDRIPYAGDAGETDRIPYAGDAGQTDRVPYAGDAGSLRIAPGADRSSTVSGMITRWRISWVASSWRPA